MKMLRIVLVAVCFFLSWQSFAAEDFVFNCVDPTRTTWRSALGIPVEMSTSSSKTNFQAGEEYKYNLFITDRLGNARHQVVTAKLDEDANLKITGTVKYSAEQVEGFKEFGHMFRHSDDESRVVFPEILEAINFQKDDLDGDIVTGEDLAMAFELNFNVGDLDRRSTASFGYQSSFNVKLTEKQMNRSGLKAGAGVKSGSKMRKMAAKTPDDSKSPYCLRFRMTPEPSSSN